MPHATNDDEGMANDEEGMVDVEESAAIHSFLNERGADYGDQFDHVIDQREKADDAVDYEDISDEDDLPEEEEATTEVNGNNESDDQDFVQALSGIGSLQAEPRSQTNGYHIDPDAKEQPTTDLFGDSDEVHDLFGDHSSSPEQQRAQPSTHAHPPPRPPGLALPKLAKLALPDATKSYQQPQSRQVQRSQESMSPPSSYRDDGYSPAASEEDDDLDDNTLLQRRMFKLAALKRAGKEVHEDLEEVDTNVFYGLFPSFETNQNPNFVKLFPPRPVTYRGKVPLKPPRPVIPTKLSLDLMADQEKAFRAPGLLDKTESDHARRDGLVYLNLNSGMQDDSDDDLALSTIDENEHIGGVTMQDLAVLCGDWDIPSSDAESVVSFHDDVMDGEWEAEESLRPRKRQKTGALDTDFSLSVRDPQLPFEEPERATAKLAKTVALDLNDLNLLVDEQVSLEKRAGQREAGRDRTSSKTIAKRYNISNDEAYDLLKENHQHKVRSTLGAMAVEHSLPAARLQYPFYKISMDSKAKRSFHRPALDIYDGRREIRFQKSKHVKRKHLRGREVKDIFSKAEDLSLGDNSNVLLLEYSEEAPVMMSNFGMGNRLINFYRKREADDQERPKRDIGETQVLLTQDKSPFSNFGHVDRGEIVPTIQNGMYRAPVFQHKANPTDFLVGLSTTYQNGHKFYLRNVENLHIVGQQFPLTEVPGEHSRKVTDAAKKRLRALSYRMYSKSVDPTRPRAKPLNNENLIPHIPGHDVAQTRSKMREFMKYERGPGKESSGVWVPQPGQVVPDAETLRSWIKPEEVCLLDSMQVGAQHLKDLGITDSKEADDDKDLDDSANIELKLAPWRTTKNFLAACQGKAMLQLHGDGDPTGRGEGFSFVKTSMKGGYRAAGESAADKIEAKKRRETGGHSYNVAQQQKAYDKGIRDIWNKQKESLSAEVEFSEMEGDDEPDEAPSVYPSGRGATPRSSFGTPAAFSRRDDESASQFSRGSADRGDKVLTITRVTTDKYGHPTTTYEKVTNPQVIASYRKKKMQNKVHALNLLALQPSGNPEFDAVQKQRLEKELARVERNVDRRQAREKAKGFPTDPQAAASPGGPSDTDGTPQKGRGRNKDGTARKCANCGQVGHIKTNRKLCPMLNGTMKPEDAGANGDTFGAVPAPLAL